jgi:hypothetical protein
MREAFRLQQHSLSGNDCVIRLVRPPIDPPLARAEVEELLIRSVKRND